jgi:eukaryotic-like serine/threonine-protein kinase
MTQGDQLHPTSTPRPSPWPPEGLCVHVIRQYALRAEIASGSVATVYLGRLLGPDDFERTVVVRRLRAAYAKDPECVRTFVGGARRAGAVRHPNVVATLDVVTGGEVMTVAEYIHGESLTALLRTERGRGSQTPVPVASGVFAGVLRGLDAAVASGRASGDDESVRTGVLGARDVVVGVDGVARLVDVVGRPGVEGRSPLFGVAAALWEALAGRPLPPPAQDGFDPPSRYRPQLDPAIDGIVTRGLAGEGAVFGTPGEMARALEEAAAPASPAQIGAWVESLAHDALQERARLLCEIESTGGPGRAPTSGASDAQAPALVPAGGDVPGRSDVPTRRLRSTPPPAGSQDVPAVDPRRAEVTARRAVDASVRGRARVVGAVLVGAGALFLLCARYLGGVASERAATLSTSATAAAALDPPGPAASTSSRADALAPPLQAPPPPERTIGSVPARSGATPTTSPPSSHGREPAGGPRRAPARSRRDDVL